MFRLTKGEIIKVMRGGRVEIFRRKGGGELSELYRLSRGKPVSARVCSGVQNRDIYTARLIVRTGKKMRGGECVYGYYITVLEIDGRKMKNE